TFSSSTPPQHPAGSSGGAAAAETLQSLLRSPAVNGRASRLDEFLHTNHQPPQPQPRMQSRSLDRITRYAQPRAPRASRGSLRRQQQKQQPQGFAFSSPTCADSIMTRSLPPPSAVAMATTLGDVAFSGQTASRLAHFESLNSRLRSLMAARQAELERDRAYLLKCQKGSPTRSPNRLCAPPAWPRTLLLRHLTLLARQVSGVQRVGSLARAPAAVHRSDFQSATIRYHGNLHPHDYVAALGPVHRTAKRTIDSLATPKAFKVKLQDFDGGSPDGVRPNPANCPAEPAAAVPPPAAATAAKKPRSLLGRLARMKTRSAAAGSQQPPAKADFDGAEETPAATAAEAPVEARGGSELVGSRTAGRHFASFSSAAAADEAPAAVRHWRASAAGGAEQPVFARQSSTLQLQQRSQQPGLTIPTSALEAKPATGLGTRAPPAELSSGDLPPRAACRNAWPVFLAPLSRPRRPTRAPAPSRRPQLRQRQSCSQRLSQVENEAGFLGFRSSRILVYPISRQLPSCGPANGSREDSDGIASPSATADAEEAGAPVALRSAAPTPPGNSTARSDRWPLGRLVCGFERLWARATQTRIVTMQI
uniref:Protein kinase domain-containing protein n=1 Tax=Macrostomum lignano TaxID=282301 RepID=A0A1I8JMW5_9PLAT